ncbi:MAG: TonB-dependent receptor [Bacteroidales bacterium]|nr:TonB-dependent receptor [Bacteroidales bacterium]MCF8391618.1 TonB-dependent receptor [Bacteroidales bacterium]
MKKLNLASLFLFISSLAFSQTYTISGEVYNRADKGETLIGANVVYGPTKGVITNYEGKYTIDLAPGDYKLEFSYVGFDRASFDITVTNKDQILNVGLNSIAIGEVVIVADVARSRETPVAFSTITPAKLAENLAAQDIPMILNSTPGVYATQEGGGDGDAQVTIRGFSSRNVGVLLDGVPVNDMENGHVYWSNWFGLESVTRSIQVQRGLGASKLALPSVGGTINIITKGLDSKKGGEVSQEVGENGYLRSSFGYNSGKLENGWGFSVAGSYKRGNGWVDQTWTKGFFYYLKVDKQLGKHLISLSGYGAPQSHGQRAYQLPIAVYDSAYAEAQGIRLAYTDGMTAEEMLEVDQNRAVSDEGIGRGLRFNQHWGYLTRTLDGPNAPNEILTERVNVYHKPQFTLKDFWSVNDNLYISNIAYLSIGNGGGVREKSTTNPNEDGLKDFQSIYNRNIGSGTISTLYDDNMHGSANYIRMLVNEHFWYGVLSTINYRPTNTLNFSAGIDLRSYNGTHYEKIYDLLGGDYVAAPAEFIDNTTIDWSSPNPLSDYMLFEGDKTNYYTDGYVRWGGLFFQTEYKKDKISSFLNLTTAISSYKQIAHFYGFNKKISVKETDWNNFPGLTAKGGLNYNFNARMNGFVNLGYLSKAPRFNNVYDFDNALFAEIKNEYVKAIEVGYSYTSGKFSANLNSYYTAWENKPVESASKVSVEVAPGEYEEQSVNINGLDALHKGVELDFIYKITNKLDFQGLASLGDWRWNSSDTVRVYDDFNNLVKTQFFDATGVHVGNSAQMQFGGELRWEPIEGLYFKPTVTYFGNYYANFDPISLNGSPTSYEWYDAVTGEHGNSRDSWKVPAYILIDFHTGYRTKINDNSIQFRLNVLNIFNTKYIATAQNNEGYNGQAYNDFDAKSSAVFFGLGRRINLSVQYSF